jgi:hypothetical protein
MKKYLFLALITCCGSLAQSQDSRDDLTGRFQDDLLDNLVGTWKATTLAHGFASTAIINVSWVLNHQFLSIHFKGKDTVPWWHLPMEYQQFIGYNRAKGRYHFHGMSIEGDADASEGFGYAYRTGNVFKFVARMSADTAVIQRFIWEPASRTWSIKSTGEINGTEGPEVFLEMKLVAAGNAKNSQ